MKNKSIPIRFNEELFKNEKELALLLGLEGTYGEVPAVIRFCINFTLDRLKRDEKFIPYLDETEFNYWLSSVKKLRKEETRKKIIENLDKHT